MLEIKELHKSFGRHEVLKGLNLSVKQGDVVAILGRSGSGKTTLLRCMNFLETAQSGTMAFDGELFNLAHITKQEIARVRKKPLLYFRILIYSAIKRHCRM